MTMWPKGLVVAVHCKVNDIVTERLVEAVASPLEKVLRGIERVEEINTCTTHYSVEAEIRFKGETTQHDLTTVTKHIEQINFGEQVQIMSRTAELRPPRLSFDDQEWKAGDSK
jgi:multidrug efflux pump subunit AcrB